MVSSEWHILKNTMKAFLMPSMFRVALHHKWPLAPCREKRVEFMLVDALPLHTITFPTPARGTKTINPRTVIESSNGTSH